MIVLATFTGTFLGVGLQQVALKFTNAGIVQTLTATSPLFVLPMIIILGEKVSFRAVLGTFIALAGVALLFGYK
jgi:drug/metabolite transporter (DMT)-like permease